MAIPPVISTAKAIQLVRNRLQGKLSSEEVDRLLSLPESKQAIAQAFKTYDGQHDTIDVYMQENALHVHVVSVEKSKSCRPGPRTEIGTRKQICQTFKYTSNDALLRWDSSTWKAPAPKPAPKVVAKPEPKPKPQPKRRRRRPKPVVAEKPQPPMKDGPKTDMLLDHMTAAQRRRSQCRWGTNVDAQCDDPTPVIDTSPIRKKTAQVISGYATFQKNTVRYDNMLKHPVPPPTLQRLYGQLARPKPGRLLSGAPIPDAPIREPSKACAKTYASKNIPSLTCFRVAFEHGRAQGKTAALETTRIVLSFLQLTSLPIVRNALQAAINSQRRGVRDSSNAGPHLWAMTWVTWHVKNPGHLVKALAQLSGEERAYLRSKTRVWWRSKAYASYHTTLDRIYRFHFTQLYPEAQGRDGLPNRSVMNSDYLWATNWLTAINRLPTDQIQSTFRALNADSRFVIRGMIKTISTKHYTKAAEVIAAS